MNSGVLRTAYQIAHPNTEVLKRVDVGGVCSRANFIYCPQNSNQQHRQYAEILILAHEFIFRQKLSPML